MVLVWFMNNLSSTSTEIQATTNAENLTELQIWFQQHVPVLSFSFVNVLIVGNTKSLGLLIFRLQENKAAESGDKWYTDMLRKIKEAPPLSLKVALQSVSLEISTASLYLNCLHTPHSNLPHLCLIRRSEKVDLKLLTSASPESTVHPSNSYPKRSQTISARYGLNCCVIWVNFGSTFGTSLYTATFLLFAGCACKIDRQGLRPKGMRSMWWVEQFWARSIMSPFKYAK